MNGYLFLADAAAAPAATTQTTVQDTAAKPAEAVPEQSAGGGLLGMLPFIAIIVVFLLFMNRSQKKQQQRRAEALSKIMKGDRVVTNAGLYGTITEVKEDSFMLEIAPKVVVEVAKTGVATALAPQDKAAESKDPKKLDNQSYDSAKTEK